MTYSLKLCATALAIALPQATPAASQAEIEALAEAMRLSDVFEIMREEGLTGLEDDEMPSSPGWRRSVSQVYDPSEMEAVFRARFDEILRDADVAPLLDFFESATGQQVVSLELAAREAFLDETVEEAALERWEGLGDDDPVRKAQLRSFVDVNNLIDMNVEGALNSNLEFYRGMATGPDITMDEEFILSTVWSQEAEIREDTTDWVHAYVTLAYEPLSDEQFGSYLDLSQTEAGRALNRALFGGFAVMFDGISYELGRATAMLSVGEEL